MKKLFLIFIISISACLAQVNLHKGNTNAIGADTYITSPVHRNIGKIHSFVLVILFLMALVASYKIYHRWQMGEEEVLPLIYRWWGGIILCFFIIQFLRGYITQQSFGEYQPISF